MRSSIALALTLAACDRPVAHGIVDNVQFVRWPADDVVLVASALGLSAVDPATGDATSISTEPVIAADLDPEGRVRFTESTFAPDSDVVCVANCWVDLQRSDPDGGDREILVEGAVANLWDTFVGSADGRHVALLTHEVTLGIVDLDTGDVVDGPAGTWVMSVSDDGNEVVYLEAQVPAEEPWQHFSHFDATSGEATPVVLDDDPNLVWTWRYLEGDHKALLHDGTWFGLVSLATGAREWTLDLGAPSNAGSISLSADGRWLSVFTDDDVLHAIDMTSGTEVGTVRHGLGQDVWSGQGAVSPDGTQVAFLVDGDLWIEPVER